MVGVGVRVYSRLLSPVETVLVIDFAFRIEIALYLSYTCLVS